MIVFQAFDKQHKQDRTRLHPRRSQKQGNLNYEIVSQKQNRIFLYNIHLNLLEEREENLARINKIKITMIVIIRKLWFTMENKRKVTLLVIKSILI